MPAPRRTTRPRLTAALALAAMTLLPAACTGASGAGTSTGASSGAPTGDAATPSSASGLDDFVAPTAAPLGIRPTTPEGTRTEVFPGLTFTLPTTATEVDGRTTTGQAPNRVFRLGAPGETFPALEVVDMGAGGGSLASSTWTQEKLALADPAITDIRRSLESWPGAAEAVAITWTQTVGEGEDEITLDSLLLWVRATSGDAFRIAVHAPTGHLEGSDALAVALSAELSATTAG